MTRIYKGASEMKVYYGNERDKTLKELSVEKVKQGRAQFTFREIQMNEMSDGRRRF